MIPVAGGHEGGRVIVHSDNSCGYRHSIEQDYAGHQQFCLSSYFANCRYEMQPITRGNCVALEFKLMSSKPLPRTLPLVSLPKFFSVLTEVKESLSSWKDWTPISYLNTHDTVAGKLPFKKHIYSILY